MILVRRELAGWLFRKPDEPCTTKDLVLQRIKGGGVAGNYFNTATGDEYWVSGIKNDGRDRHWAGGGAVSIDKDARVEYEKILSS